LKQDEADVCGLSSAKGGFSSDNVDPTNAEFDQKSGCDGQQPRCQACIVHRAECRYDKPPSLAYVTSLEQRIVVLERQLHEAKTQAWLDKVRADV
jgi:Fungal Zn(2)-Cys(6) binuclear cluster domain